MQVYLIVYKRVEGRVWVLLTRKNLMYGPTAANHWVASDPLTVLHSAGQNVFPGGGNKCRTPQEGAATEFFEETGYRVGDFRLIQDISPRGCFVGCTPIENTDVPADNPVLHGQDAELCEIGWVTLDEAKRLLGTLRLNVSLAEWQDGHASATQLILLTQYLQANAAPNRGDLLRSIELEMAASASWYIDALARFINERIGE